MVVDRMKWRVIGGQIIMLIISINVVSMDIKLYFKNDFLDEDRKVEILSGREEGRNSFRKQRKELFPKERKEGTLPERKRYEIRYCCCLSNCEQKMLCNKC